MRCISLKNQAIGEHPITYLGESYTPRLLTPLNIVGIGIVRRVDKEQRHYVASLVKTSTFHADFSYALANVFDSNLTLKLKVRYVEDLVKNGRRRYPVSVHMCARMGTSRSNRLFVVHSRTFRRLMDGRTDERTNDIRTYCLPKYTNYVENCVKCTSSSL